MMTTLFQVALGGAIGASGRYLTGAAAVRLIGHGFPWGTLIVNVVGSFAMGLLVVTLAHYHAHKFAPMLITGVLGGFTTFSAFSLDTVTLLERGAISTAAVYLLSSILLAIGGLLLGLTAARGWFA